MAFRLTNSSWMIAASLTIGAPFTANAQIFEFDEGESSNSIIYDAERNTLLISTDEGDILRFDLATQSFDDPIEVDGVINGLAIDPITGFLFAGQEQLNTSGMNDLGVLNRIDLDTMTISEINYVLDFAETGSFDVAFASNGTGFFTTRFAGSGWVPLRQFDATTGVTTVRPDAPNGPGGEVRQNTHAVTDASGRYILMNESNISSFPLHIYDSVTDSFIATTDNFTNRDLPSFANGVIDISGDAGLVAVPSRLGGVQLLDLDLDPVATIGETSTFSIFGLAFSPDGETLYVLDTSEGALIGYSTTTFEETSRRLTNNGFFPNFGSFDRSSNLLTIDTTGENVFVDFGSGFELINFATFRSFCEFTIPGEGGTVVCSVNGSRSFVSSLNSLDVTVEQGVILTGAPQVFNFGGNDITLTNAGIIRGDIDFAFSEESDDVLVNAGEITGSIQFRQGDDRLINAAGGIIRGRVGMGRGNDIVTLENGSLVDITAEVRLGQGTNRIVVEEGASVLGRIVGFQAFNAENTNTADIMEDEIDLGLFAGIGTFNLNTDGVVDITANRSLIASELNLTSGGLRIDGAALLDRLQLLSGTELSGTGQLLLAETLSISGTLAPGAQVAPGLGQGTTPGDVTFSVTGDVEFAPGSVLAIQVFDSNEAITASEVLIVDGGVAIGADTTLRITAADGALPPGRSDVSVITASAGITGEFTSIDLPLNFVLDSASYSEGTASLSIRSQFGAGLDLSTVDTQVTEYLDRVSLAPDRDATAELLQDLLGEADGDQLNAAFADLSAEPLASYDQINVEAGLALVDAIGTALRSENAERGKFKPWIAGVNTSVDQTSSVRSGTELEYQAGLFGVSFGLSQASAVGLFVGPASYQQDFNALDAEIDGVGIVAGLFTTGKWGDATFDTLVAISNSTAEAERDLSYFDGRAASDTELSALIASATAGYGFEFGSNSLVRPSGGFTFISSERQATEETSGVAALEIDEQTNRYAFAELGATLTVIDPIRGVFRPYIEAIGRVETFGDESDVRASLLGESEFYKSRGVTPEREQVFIRAGFEVDVYENLKISALYSERFANDTQSQGATLAVTLAF